MTLRTIFIVKGFVILSKGEKSYNFISKNLYLTLIKIAIFSIIIITLLFISIFVMSIV